MILPIVAYGNKILKEKSKDITKDYPDLKELIANMFETMYQANGVGLAAPQVGLDINLLVIDANPFAEKYPEGEGFCQEFINPVVLEEKGDKWFFEEGCLSLPGVHEDVLRSSIVKVKYYDSDFVEHTDELFGVRARVFQHEYDHLQGIVFTDRLSALRRTLLKRKLSDIVAGKVNTDYKIKFSHSIARR